MSVPAEMLIRHAREMAELPADGLPTLAAQLLILDLAQRLEEIEQKRGQHCPGCHGYDNLCEGFQP